MTKAFSVLSWNVEHFRDDPARVAEVVRIVPDIGPDVFALYEVEGKRVFAELVSQMPDYQSHIIEGPQMQEILIGVRGGLSAFFTKKIEFRAGTTNMRPGLCEATMAPPLSTCGPELCETIAAILRPSAAA